MTSKRGRWSQYQILSTDENLQPFLLSTVIFKEEAFYKNSQKHLTIRPCFGKQEIYVTQMDEEQYLIKEGCITTILSGKTEVFNFLMKVCIKDKFYILQDESFFKERTTENVELFVTVHREKGENSNWIISDLLEKSAYTKTKIIKLWEQKIQELAIQTAIRLEPLFPECSTIVLDIGLTQENMWIRDIEFHSSKSKWSQHQILTSIGEVTSFIPYSQLATPDLFLKFIQTNKQVFLKPCHGQWGIGIIQVSLLEGGVYEVHKERKKYFFNNKIEIIEYLQSHHFSKESYLLQSRLSLATINDCVMDFRVVIQREIKNPSWEITAVIAKVASKNFIVTNVAKSLLPFDEALKNSSISHMKHMDLLKKVKRVCLNTTIRFGKYFPKVNTIGMDVGIDNNGDIWIIEANLVPDINLFKRLEDKSIYEKIINKRQI